MVSLLGYIWDIYIYIYAHTETNLLLGKIYKLMANYDQEYLLHQQLLTGEASKGQKTPTKH